MVYLNAHYAAMVCLGIYGLTRSGLGFCNNWTLKINTNHIGTRAGHFQYLLIFQ